MKVKSLLPSFPRKAERHRNDDDEQDDYGVEEAVTHACGKVDRDLQRLGGCLSKKKYKTCRSAGLSGLFILLPGEFVVLEVRSDEDIPDQTGNSGEEEVAHGTEGLRPVADDEGVGEPTGGEDGGEEEVSPGDAGGRIAR